MRVANLMVLSFFLVIFGTAAKGQTSTKDISAVFAEGKVSGNEYKNDYFGLTLTPAGAQFVEGFISSAGTRARLIEADANVKNWEDRYSIAVLADALSANPLVQSPAHYARSLRHQLEREGMTTAQEESPIEISGLPFVQAAMKVTEQGQTHYQGMYTTFLNGYILSLQVEAATPERLKQIVLSMVKFNVPPPPAVVFYGKCANELPSYPQWFQQTRLPYSEPYLAPDARKQEILEQYPRLRLQMSLEEVKRLLGKPDFSVPHPAARLATTPEPAEEKCSNQVAYVVKKNNENMADMDDVAIYLFFSADGRLSWATPQNLPNLKQLGSAIEESAPRTSN